MRGDCVTSSQLHNYGNAIAQSPLFVPSTHQITITTTTSLIPRNFDVITDCVECNSLALHAMQIQREIRSANISRG